MKKIPFVDLKAQYRAIQPEIDAAIRDTLENTAFIMGDRVQNFEKDFARFCKTPFAIACSSGTTALHLALLAAGVGSGDEVITVANTFIATAEPICHCGATPVFVDVDPESFTLDPAALENAITPKTRAVIPVHLYGQCADMDPILKIADQHNLAVIEDCAQAHGALYKGRCAGSMGDFGCFSFFPGKNLGAYGDAGMVTTRDPDKAERLRLLVNHGRETKYEHRMIGYNYRMDALQAAILGVKLPHLSDWITARRRVAQRYGRLLEHAPVTTPMEREHHVYHLYVIQCDRRDELRRTLADEGIAAGIHYPIPLHLQPCFSSHPQAGPGHLPITEQAAPRLLSLPVFPELEEEDQARVAEVISRFYG